MSHVVASETIMPIQRLMRLVESDDGLMAQVRWKGLQKSEDTPNPIANFYKDVPGMLLKML